MTEPILVTGGDGFLGRAVADHLTGLGVPVFVVDDHSTSAPRPVHPLRDTIVADVAELDVSRLPRVSAVLHFASPAVPALFAERPLATIRPNVHGTERMIEVARRDGCRLLYTSTSEVYGDGDPSAGEHQAFREDQVVSHATLTERSCYAVAKRLGEELVAAARRDGVDALSIRPFNVYGPGMDPTRPGYGRVVPNFLRAALRGLPIPVHGDGGQVRSFLWIDDFVRAVVGLLGAAEVPTVVNVGRDEPVSIRHLADVVERVVGQELSRSLLPRPSDDPDWRRPDCTLLTEVTGWVSAVSLEAGLRRLVLEARRLTESAAPALAEVTR